VSGDVLRFVAEVGPQASWVVALFAGVVITLTLYLGVAAIAAISTGDEKRREVAYQIFHDLVDFLREALFRRRGER
jgi:hypothetical protein